MSTMNALVVEKPGVAALKAVPIPSLAPSEVLVKVCSSLRPPLPFLALILSSLLPRPTP